MTKQAKFNVIPHNNKEPFILHLKGRNAWTMRQLIKAADKGCTPIDNPAPRWSAYVYNLRHMGVFIETVSERHSGPFAGHHARYVLHDTVCEVCEAG